MFQGKLSSESLTLPSVQTPHITNHGHLQVVKALKFQSHRWYRAPFLCSGVFLCSDKMAANTGEMLMEGNEGTVPVLLPDCDPDKSSLTSESWISPFGHWPGQPK